MTDTQIIELYWNRSEDAIAETEAAYGRKLLSLSHRILQNQEDAAEIVNDTYMKTWTSIPTARPKYFYAYLATICRHLAFNLLNWNQAEKRKAEIVAITDEMESCIPDCGGENTLRGKEIARALDAFLETLPKEQRLLFVRRYWFADSVVEIAKRYNLTESNVKTRLFRTRNKLRDYLEQEGIQI